MQCRYLTCHRGASNTWQVNTCDASGQLYVPSLRELDTMCRTGHHQFCPSFRVKIMGEAPPADRVILSPAA